LASFKPSADSVNSKSGCHIVQYDEGDFTSHASVKERQSKLATANSLGRNRDPERTIARSLSCRDSECINSHSSDQMTDEQGYTTQLEALLDRWGRGDETAIEELIGHSQERLRRMASRTIKRRWRDARLSLHQLLS
jgi:hypothetical protein